ncbi:transposase [Martelella mediterranea]|uniref:transposase n=1 Tax=Martelella mediterranea TaxID=293089 RepID=UPI00399D77A8
MRWPDGPVCGKCGDGRPSWVESRRLFQCRRCRYQYSVTAGTNLHRTRIDLRLWFHTAEVAIRSWSSPISVRAVAIDLGVPVATAHRMRKIVLKDISRDGRGLLSEAVCLPIGHLPDGIVAGSPEHLERLKLQRARHIEDMEENFH